MTSNNPVNQTYIIGLTLVAALGGLLFGYDTAVISGTVGSLEAFFVKPLHNDPGLASVVIGEYRVIISLSFLFVTGLLINFIFRLYSITRASLISLIILAGAVFLWYTKVYSQANEVSEGLINSIKGFTVSSALVGCIIGGSLGGFISQQAGRRRGLLIAAALFTISAIGSAFPDSLNFTGYEVISSFIVYRIIGGIGVGIASMLAPMYIAEIAPAAIRGKLVSWNQFAIIFGMLVVYFVNFSIALQGDDTWLNETGWRYMFFSETIPAGIFLVVLFFVPETPRYLVLSGKPSEALRILNRINGPEKADTVLNDIRESLVVKRAHWMSFGGLVIIIGILLSVFQQFVGINVVLYYAPEIFRNMGSSTNSSLLQTIIVGFINLTFTIIAIFSVDKFGRKPLLILGALGMAVSMILLGLFFYFDSLGVVALLMMLLYVASFAISWGPVVWVMLSEIFPNSIRGVMSIAVAAQWLANLVVSWTFPMMNDSSLLTRFFHHGFSYWIYGLMSLLAAWFVYRLVPETKQKTLEELEKHWKS